MSTNSMKNVDLKTVEGFGDEWTRFHQSSLSQDEFKLLFEGYFDIFPWEALPREAVGFDLGCGSGRWAKGVAPRVGKLHCIDASAAALQVAERNLSSEPNCEFHLASVDSMPLEDGSMDFGYSLGVLHHVPDTLAGLQACVRKLKPGAPFLLYLYYAFDNRPPWYRLVWRVSDALRKIISKLPYRLRYWISNALAIVIYFPLARLSLVLDRLGFDVERIPLSSYRNRSLYSMRTDSLDRFGTRLEQRFTAETIRAMMLECGLERIEFSKTTYWCAIGYKAERPPVAECH